MDALKFITCGSVDDGKSTLIGRLLVDSRAVLQDHLAGVTRGGTTDLALLTDGLSAEREQGITIDVAYRYFSTEDRKFIIGDAPGHEQYTRNMVTAASSADAAVVLVDATKLDWALPSLQLLPQTRRHALLCRLLRVPSIVFAVNKLDAVTDASRAFRNIADALSEFARTADLPVRGIVPISALEGWNVVDAGPEGHGRCGHEGPTLLDLLGTLPATPQDTQAPLALPVQWIEKQHHSAVMQQGRRVFWGRMAAGTVAPGMPVRVFPGGQTAIVAQVLDHARQRHPVEAGRSAGVVLDREVDISRGDWLLADPLPYATTRELSATVAWMDEEPLVPGRTYWALHGHRWIKAKVRRVVHRLDIHTLAEQEADQLGPNDIGRVELVLQEPVPAVAFELSRALGALILVDTATHKTSGAVLLNRST